MHSFGISFRVFVYDMAVVRQKKQQQQQESSIILNVATNQIVAKQQRELSKSTAFAMLQCTKKEIIIH